MEVNAIGRHDMATLSALLARYKDHRWLLLTEGQCRSFDDFVVVNFSKLLHKRSSGGDLRRPDVHVTSP